MKYLRRVSIALGITALGVGIAVFVFCIKSLQYESYSRGTVAEDIPLENASQNFSELYTEIFEKCRPYVKDHILVQLEGRYMLEDETVHYREAEFVFYRYVDERAEGGRISVIQAKVSMEERMLDIYSFYGAGRAYSPAGSQEIEAEELDSVTEHILDNPDMQESGHFTFWKGREGEPVVLNM